MQNRAQQLQQLRDKPDVPVLIVGGGVIGAGLFRDLALQGVNVLLVDRTDFSAGCSAAPSRMIHGGLRYLEFGEFDLVRESVTERNRLLRNAPHYVRTLPTTIPVMSRFSGLGHVVGKWVGYKCPRPNQRGSVLVKMGLTIYDWVSRKTRVMPKHSFASRAASLARRPLLDPDIRCTAKYYDASISYPERLCLELILDGEAQGEHARAVSYLSLAGASGDTVSLRDELTGDQVEVKPGIVVNATGPWIDFTNGRLGRKTEMVGGTKGAHLILDNPSLVEQLDGDMVFYETPEGRVCITFAWLGKALIGSTDIRIDDPDEAVCDEDEIDYMLKAIKVPFPDLEIDRSQILSSFSGVRPLRSMAAKTTGQMSRAHLCEVQKPDDTVGFPVYNMIGGKWTPFRAFAEQVTDKLLDALGRTRQTRTEDLAIGGGAGYPRDDNARRQWLAGIHADTGIAEERLSTLLDRYGTRAAEIAAYTVQEPDEPLNGLPTYTRREIECIVRNERVYHLTDLVLRRTAIALLGDLTAPLLDELAAIAAPVRGWSEEETQADVERTKEILKPRFHVDLG